MSNRRNKTNQTRKNRLEEDEQLGFKLEMSIDKVVYPLCIFKGDLGLFIVGIFEYLGVGGHG